MNVRTYFLAVAVTMLTCAHADTLQPLGDEFLQSATQSNWSLLSETEGWQANQLEVWNINTDNPGHMRMTPYTSSWFGELRGVLVYKEITGDFVATTRLRVRSRHNLGNPYAVPNRSFTLTGIFARAPRPITQGAPSPYTTIAVWPPQDFGSQWTTNGENYIFLSYGTAGNPGTRQCEIKSTFNSNSHLYFHSNGVPQGATAEAAQIWLQMIRIGNTVVCLRKHAEADPWIVENRYPNPDHPFPNWGDTIQIGITTYTDWESINNAYFFGGNTLLSAQRAFHHNYTQLQTGANVHGGAPHAPDLTSDIDYIRYERPDPSISEAELQALVTTYVPLGSPQGYRANPVFAVQTLPGIGDVALLGNNANTALGSVNFESPTMVATELISTVEIPVVRSGESTNEAFSLQYSVTGDSAAAGEDFTAVSGTLTWGENDVLTKTISVPLLADTLAEGPEEFTVTLSQPDGPAVLPNSVSQITATVTIADHPFDQWRLDRFGPGLANMPGHGAGDDGDGDGLENLLEYGFDTPPGENNIVPWSIEYLADTVEIQFSPPATPGALLKFTTSDDLSGWDDAATRATGSSEWTTEPGISAVVDLETEEVTVQIPLVPERAFFRMEVERAVPSE